MVIEPTIRNGFFRDVFLLLRAGSRPHGLFIVEHCHLKFGGAALLLASIYTMCVITCLYVLWGHWSEGPHLRMVMFQNISMNERSLLCNRPHQINSHDCNPKTPLLNNGLDDSPIPRLLFYDPDADYNGLDLWFSFFYDHESMRAMDQFLVNAVRLRCLSQSEVQLKICF